MHLLQVVFLISALIYSVYDGAWFSIFWKVVVAYLLLKLAFLSRSRFNTSRRMIQIATWSDSSTPLGRAVVNLNVTKVMRQLVSLGVAGRPATLTDVIAKAVGQAVEETEDLCGNLVFGLFFPSTTANVALLLSNPAVEGDNIITLKRPSTKSVSEIGAERTEQAKQRNGKNATTTQGFPGILFYLPSSLMALYVSFQEFVTSVRIALGGANAPQVLLTEVGYVGEMTAFISPPPLFRGPLTICASTVTEEVVVDESGAPAIAQVAKLGISFDFRYVTHPQSLKVLQRIRFYVESGKAFTD